MRFSRRAIFTAVAAAVAGSGVSGVSAQDKGASRLEEVTITARRIEENLQDVPVAISAFSAEEMRKRGMRELEDVALATPGFSFEDYGGGYGVPVIRGASQQRIQDLDQTTSVFLDGIYLPRQYMVDFGTVAFERIEIAKGPQSALYGRNSFSGAVNYVSGGPTDELAAEVTATAGTDELLEYQAEVSGPIIEGKLAGRLLYAYSEFDGTWNNDWPVGDDRNYGKQGTTDNLGGWENSTWGVNLEATPTERLLLELDYYKVERFQESPSSVRAQSPFDMTCVETLNGGFRFICGELPDTFVPLPGGSPEGTERISDPRNYLLDVETDFAMARATFEFNDSWEAVYQFGYSDTEVVAVGTGDRDPLVGSINFFTGQTVNFVQAIPNGTNEYSSHELRLQYSSGQWSGLAGVFTSKLEDFDRFDLAFAPFLDPEPIEVDPEDGVQDLQKFNLGITENEFETDAIFARIAYETADARWRFSAEARYQDEEKTLTNLRGATPVVFNDSWDSFTPRFTADYRINDRQMLYASIANGEKAGGFNGTVFNEVQRTYEPDSNWTYEIGSKNDLLDGRLRMNVAVFYTDWTDLQITVAPLDIPENSIVNPPGVVGNTGGAEILGIELDGTWYATDMLSFDYAFSQTQAEYSSGSVSGRLGLAGACDDILCAADGSIGGNQLQRQPETQVALSANLVGTFAGGWDWSARADLNYQSKQYVDEFNLGWVPDRTLVNMRAEISNPHWTVALWGKNVFDEEYGANAFATVLPTATSYAQIFGQKATFGLSVGYKL